MLKYRYAFYLVWFTTFLIYWGVKFFLATEIISFIGFLFFSHIFAVAFSLNRFIENIIKYIKETS